MLLTLLVASWLHVIAEIIKAEFVVCAVSDVAAVDIEPLASVHFRLDRTDAQAQGTIEGAHPFRIAAGEVIVHRHHVNAFAFERVQVSWKCRDQCFTFTGHHFRDIATVQNHPTDHLNIVMTHVQESPTSFAADGKGFGKNVVEGLSTCQTPAKFDGLFFELDVGQSLNRWLE